MEITAARGHLLGSSSRAGTFKLYLQPDGSLYEEDSRRRYLPIRDEAGAFAGISDVNSVLKKTVQLLESDARAASVDIQVRYDDLVPPVAGDPEQLRQVFLNLGLNALQAMPEGGTLEIITTRRRRSTLGYGSFAEIRFRSWPNSIESFII